MADIWRSRDEIFKIVCKMHNPSAMPVPMAFKGLFPGSLNNEPVSSHLCSTYQNFHIIPVFPGKHRLKSNNLFPRPLPLIFLKPPKNLVKISKDFHDRSMFRASIRVTATALGPGPKVSLAKF